MGEFANVFAAFIDKCVSKSINKLSQSNRVDSNTLGFDESLIKLENDLSNIDLTLTRLDAFVDALKNDIQLIKSLHESKEGNGNNRTSNDELHVNGTTTVVENGNGSSILQNGHSLYSKRRLHTARKRTGMHSSSISLLKPSPIPPPRSRLLNDSLASSLRLDSTDIYHVTRRPKIIIQTKAFTPHSCSSLCIPKTIDHQSLRFSEEIPYAIPVILGWQREIMTAQMKIEKSHQIVSAKVLVYVSPCGRRLRNIEELDNYLALTQCPLSIDYFTFEPHVSLYSFCAASPIRCNWVENDITNGREMKKISAINTFDNAPFPPDFYYIPQRYEGRDVDIPLDPSFLIRCDCADDCRNRATCACQMLTVDSTAALPVRRKDTSAGYSHQRLKKFLITGIYECNPYCSCSKTCRNKVAQNGIKVRLQIFKTVRRGWGVRCLHDIPEGTFISTYAGEVMTEHEANRNASIFGDEYLADLDFIEVCENAKEDYEPAPLEEISSDDEDFRDDGAIEDDSNTSDDSFSSIHVKGKRKSESRANQANNKRSNGGFNKNIGGSNSHSRSTINGNSNNGKSCNSYSSSETNQSDSSQSKSLRSIFKENFIYTLDTARLGNIGRFLNHSCSPNCFAQNVFVDTHDLRFPWVAFFADKFIPAFSELTWDYNYEVGSVEGKVIRCYCNANECRNRLL